MSSDFEPEPAFRRVVVVAPTPPEKSAYALARYSRSADSVVDSLDWVRSHSSEKFLDSFYFQYGHASIADLGHCIFCFEGVSELAAIEIEDEQLWDGQAKSTRYQDFSKAGAITPPELVSPEDRTAYEVASRSLIESYLSLHSKLKDYLAEKHPRPESMKEGGYKRTIAARAFDGARYLLFLGVPTNIGQVTSIRTLEKQMSRLGASDYAEIRDIAKEMHEACAAPPSCVWDPSQASEPIAPTLAKYAEPDETARASRERMRRWAAENVSLPTTAALPDVDLIRPTDPLDEIVATLIYSATGSPFRVIHDEVSGWSRARKLEVVEVALEGRERRDEFSRAFRSGYGYVFDIVADIGAYRDMHRHRRCQQYLQPYTDALGYETPELIGEAGLGSDYTSAIEAAAAARAQVAATSVEASHYLLPFATRCRSLYKMDFAEAEYIARVRSGVKGHISYRRVAWEMKQRIEELEPELGRLIDATPPEVEDPLTR